MWLGDRQPIDVPDYALDVHTARGRKMGRGNEHFYAEAGKVFPEARLPDPYEAEAEAIDSAQEKKPTRQPEARDLSDE
jgi:hypothetical protein